MALFALSGGRIVPAQAVELDGTSATEVLGALRERALDIVGVPLFPIVWEQADRQPGESHLLTMDSAGNTVIVSIRAHFSAVSLFEALSLAGRYSSMSRREIVAMYPGGQAAFDSAWQTFRESSPATASAGARTRGGGAARPPPPPPPPPPPAPPRGGGPGGGPGVERGGTSRGSGGILAPLYQRGGTTPAPQHEAARHDVEEYRSLVLDPVGPELLIEPAA